MNNDKQLDRIREIAGKMGLEVYDSGSARIDRLLIEPNHLVIDGEDWALLVDVHNYDDAGNPVYNSEGPGVAETLLAALKYELVLKPDKEEK